LHTRGGDTVKGTPRALSLTQGKSRKLDTTGMAPRKPVQYQARSLDEWEPVPYEPTEEDQALFDSMGHVSPLAPAYLLAFARTGISAEACRRVGISESLPRVWKLRHPEFAQIQEDLKEGIRDRWNALARQKALGGFEERPCNASGELVGRKVREDPSFLKAVLGSLEPENWGRAGESGQSITIQVLQMSE
jgi:hypothetical protein